MFTKVLVANRGEIAVRVMQTCAEMGIATVAVYSEADAGALHVRRADESYCLGPAPAAQSYLNVERILEVAKQSGAQAIHPGYGFLAENADFAEACAAVGEVFVGPSPAAIRLLGDKQEAKRLARRVGVPVVPGYDGEQQDEATLAQEARRIGFPLLIKAAAGGGGRGMRVVRAEDDFPAALGAAQREARAAFGDGRVLLERYVEAPRHVEAQILADGHGNIVFLGERECSLQRRHQKLVEESPCVALTPAQREHLGAAAVALARAAGYVNAGTVEFLLDRYGDFSFLEVNTRLQVEHPVTEFVTGLDLVREQLRIAAGLPLSLRQEDVAPRGHAIECRLCAEDASAGFMPATGPLLQVDLPAGPGMRVDTGVQTGDTVSTFYDSLLAKLIVHAADRAACVERLAAALRRCAILGVTTNLALHQAIAAWPAFRDSRLSTTLLEENVPALTAKPALPEEVPLLAAVWQLARATTDQAPSGVVSPWKSGPWRVSGQEHVLRYQHGEQEVAVRARRQGIGGWLLSVASPEGPVGAAPRGRPTFDDQHQTAMTDEGQARGPAPTGTHAQRTLSVERVDSSVLLAREGERAWNVPISETDGALWLVLEGCPYVLQKWQGLDFDAVHGSGTASGSAADSLRARMPGTVVKVGAREGEHVEAGQTLLVLDSMKTEHLITAPRSGVVKRLPYQPGDQVPAGAVLAELEG